MGEVIQGVFQKDGEWPVQDVLDAAKGYELDSVIVIGRTNEGKLFLASSTMDASIMIFDLTIAINRLVIMSDDDDGVEDV